jgi:pimeloyl-ACP methyl ester carboxylesterase
MAIRPAVAFSAISCKDDSRKTTTSSPSTYLATASPATRPIPRRATRPPGLAAAAVELLEELGVTEAIVFGWSLGGHIGIEMVPRFSGMRGLMVTGTPPVGRNNMAQGFNASPHMGVAGKQGPLRG